MSAEFSLNLSLSLVATGGFYGYWTTCFPTHMTWELESLFCTVKEEGKFFPIYIITSIQDCSSLSFWIIVLCAQGLAFLFGFSQCVFTVNLDLSLISSRLSDQENGITVAWKGNLEGVVE